MLPSEPGYGRLDGLRHRPRAPRNKIQPRPDLWEHCGKPRPTRSTKNALPASRKSPEAPPGTTLARQSATGWFRPCW